MVEAIERFGRVDTLVNNAGVFVAKPFTEYTDGDHDLVTGVNIDGPYPRSRPGAGPHSIDGRRMLFAPAPAGPRMKVTCLMPRRTIRRRSLLGWTRAASQR
jgi:NAD(P)-dependent dehydrogenase (short-subunit alcohol dehydrogenase family)